MKLAIFSDIHGNMPYFEECLKKMAVLGAQRYVFLGDAVGYMTNTQQVVQQLRQLDAVCLMGNHEAMLLERIEAGEEGEAGAKESVYRHQQAREGLTAESRAWMEGWLPLETLELDGLRLLCVHGSPQNPLLGYVYPDSPLAAYENERFDFVFCGHTHRPFMRQNGYTTLVNVGSCGLPRDEEVCPAFALLDTETHKAQLVRVEVDAAAAAKAARSQGVHESVVDRLMRGAPGEEA